MGPGPQAEPAPRNESTKKEAGVDLTELSCAASAGRLYLGLVRVTAADRQKLSGSARDDLLRMNDPR
jgi:hypothetical protein